MKPAMKSILKAAILLFISTHLVGCFATHHTVGEGGTYEGNEVKRYDLKKKKWYLFWGGIPLDEVRADQLAGSANNYTVRETFSFGDLLINGLTVGIASPRTIRVSKSVEEK